MEKRGGKVDVKEVDGRNWTRKWIYHFLLGGLNLVTPH